MSRAKQEKEERKKSTRVQIHTRVNSDVAEQFKLFVMRKYGRLDGFYSKEIENALMFYLENYPKNQEHNTQNHAKMLHFRRQKVMWKRIARLTKSLQVYNGETLSYFAVGDLIMRTLGFGQRSWDSYIGYLITLRFLKEERRIMRRGGKKQVERYFTVIFDRARVERLNKILRDMGLDNFQVVYIPPPPENWAITTKKESD